MPTGRRTRRGLLGALAAGCLSLSGCLGGPPDCGGEGVVTVYASRLAGWYVDYPANRGAFGFGSETGERPARRLARLAREEGYTVEYYFSEDLGRGNDDSWQVELYGDLGRSTVERLVREADMPDGTEISERVSSLSRGEGLKWPWAPGLLEGRAAFLEASATTVGVDLPAFGPAGSETVTLSEPASDETRRWLREVLSGRSLLTVELLDVPRNDNALNEYRWTNYDEPDEESENVSFRHDADDVRLRDGGTVETGTFLESVLQTVYRPGRENSLEYLDRARLRVTIGGERVETRPLSDAERSYLRAYEEYIANDPFDDEAPEAPRLSLTTLGPREALRVATLLRWPTAVRFGVTVTRCRS